MKKKKSIKVAIITIESLNFGNRLQNYALQQVLLSLGIEVETIRRNMPQKGYAKLGGIFKSVIRFLGQTKVYKFTQFNKKINWSIDYALADVASHNIEKHYDFFVAGSDQIWNPFYKFVGKCDYLRFAKKEQRIAYAASFGVSEISKKKEAEVKLYLSEFSNITVREDEGAQLILKLTGKQTPVVLDPTLLLNKQSWEEIEKKPTKYPDDNISLDKPYVFIYALEENNQEIWKAINALKKKKRLQVVECGKNNKSNRKWAIGPAEFVYLIHHAEIVLTDSFHASVFSIIFHKKFCVFERKELEMSSRIDTLLKMTNLLKCKYNSIRFEDWINIDIEFEEIDRIILEKRKYSKEYLYSFLTRRNCE